METNHEREQQGHDRPHSATAFPIPSRIPVFPLPNVVLFPKTYLPLHIFEPRYRTMLSDAAMNGQCIGMALLKDGWETDYYGHPPVFSMGCVGRLANVQTLADGRSNILLQGLERFTIEREWYEKAYREATIAVPVRDTETSLDPVVRRRLFTMLRYDSRMANRRRRTMGSSDASVLEQRQKSWLHDRPCRTILVQSQTVQALAAECWIDHRPAAARWPIDRHSPWRTRADGHNSPFPIHPSAGPCRYTARLWPHPRPWRGSAAQRYGEGDRSWGTARRSEAETPESAREWETASPCRAGRVRDVLARDRSAWPTIADGRQTCQRRDPGILHRRVDKTLINTGDLCRLPKHDISARDDFFPSGA